MDYVHYVIWLFFQFDSQSSEPKGKCRKVLFWRITKKTLKIDMKIDVTIAAGQIGRRQGSLKIYKDFNS